MLKQTQVGLQPTNLAVFPAVNPIVFFFQFHHMENLQGVTSDGFHQPSCTQPHGPFGFVLHAPSLFCLCPNQPGMGLDCMAGADFLGEQKLPKKQGCRAPGWRQGGSRHHLSALPVLLCRNVLIWWVNRKADILEGLGIKIGSLLV